VPPPSQQFVAVCPRFLHLKQACRNRQDPPSRQVVKLEWVADFDGAFTRASGGWCSRGRREGSEHGTLVDEIGQVGHEDGKVGESDSWGLGDAGPDPFVVFEDSIGRGGDRKERALNVGSISSEFFFAVGKDKEDGGFTVYLAHAIVQSPQERTWCSTFEVSETSWRSPSR
jgi:hypothetical protein